MRLPPAAPAARWSRLALAASLGLALLVAGSGPAAPAAAAGAVPAPAPLLAIAQDLLGIAPGEVADVCDAGILEGEPLGATTWTGYASGGAWIRAYQNGTEISGEELDRIIFEHRAESWTSEARWEKSCHKLGGSCFCAESYTFFELGRSVACGACCPEGTEPFCVCSGMYAYASCGCERT